MDGQAPILGIHSVRAALKFGADGVTELWLERSRRDERLHELAELAKAADVTYVDIDSGHWPMISKPVELAELLAGLA